MVSYSEPLNTISPSTCSKNQRTCTYIFLCHHQPLWVSLVAQTVNNLLTIRRPGFDPWVWNILWGRVWLTALVFLPAEFHGQRSLAGYSPWVTKSGHEWATNTFTFQLLCPSLILFQPQWVLWSFSKKGNAKECSNYHTIAFTSHASKVMLKILQARLQQYVNCEFPDVQAGFKKGRGTRDQITNISWIIEKAREFQKKNPHLFLLYWLCQSLWLCGSQ